MEKQSHIFDELTVIFSQERLDGYLNHTHCNNSKNEAIIAYSWNIELSQALYPALQVAAKYLTILDQFKEIHINSKLKIKNKLSSLAVINKNC